MRQAHSTSNSPSCAHTVAGRIGDRRVSSGNLVTGGATGITTMIATIVSLEPIRFEFTMDEASYLRYERFSGSGKEVTGREGGVIVGSSSSMRKISSIRLYGFLSTITIDRSTARSAAARSLPPRRGADPRMFGRIRVPGSPTYNALLVPDVAIGTEQVRKFVLVVGDDNTAVQKYVYARTAERRQPPHHQGRDQGRRSRHRQWPDARAAVARRSRRRSRGRHLRRVSAGPRLSRRKPT